jgi:hypothetical protein
MASPTTTRIPPDTAELAAAVVRFLETGVAEPGLFAPDVFCDFTQPTWRTQSAGRAATIALRTDNHPWASRVTRHRVDPTARGFVLEFEEEWVDDAGTPWYCREILRADVGPEGIVELAVYCTGDWDPARIAAHAAAVALPRP